jgi:hypothetical protein
MRREHDITGRFLFEGDDVFRLEPLHRTSEVESGLTARIHDPAWALTRQWQLGEFAAQDAGSPVLVEVEGKSTLISHWRPALEEEGEWIPYHPRNGPLDALIEAEAPRPHDQRARVEGGARFARMLDEAGLGGRLSALLDAFAFELEDEGGGGEEADAEEDLAALLTGKVPDAEKLAKAIDAGTLPVSGLDEVARRWRRWWAELEPDPGPDTFDPSRFEHRAEFSVFNLALRAEEYLGDGLDWYSVDLNPIGLSEPAGETHRFKREALATPVRFGGLPADRFWEMEDARVDLSSADVGTLDTGRLLLIAFAEVYGNDWFLLPLEVPSGSLTELERVRVTDTFGRHTEIERAGREDPAWNMFVVEGTEEGLLVMPCQRGLSGEVLETVVLARDELANQAWAIESSYTDGRGRLIDRRNRWRAIEPDEPPRGELPAYAVQTVVPDYWLPLVPHAISPGVNRFALVPLEQPIGDSEPQGRLLTPKTWLHEEEVPREGAAVTRRPVLARWFDGSTHAWTRREKNPGSGESSSGLAFDIVRPSEPWP